MMKDTDFFAGGFFKDSVAPYGFGSSDFFDSVRKRVFQTLAKGNSELINHIEEDAVELYIDNDGMADLILNVELKFDSLIDGTELVDRIKKFARDFGLCTVRGIASTTIVDDIFTRKDFLISIEIGSLSMATFNANARSVTLEAPVNIDVKELRRH